LRVLLLHFRGARLAGQTSEAAGKGSGPSGSAPSFAERVLFCRCGSASIYVRGLCERCHSFLFARLLKSRDKVGVISLAEQGQTVNQPIDVIKQPYVLDFLNLPDRTQLHESDLESAIIENLQPFLLELGKGCAFVGRQYRVSTESQHFFIDLVFYNFLLKCFVLIDLKIGRLEHQDVGQMGMYLRMFDDLRRGEETIPLWA
jgi:predicted nuclease of restriction endonuclease-like (RecB) superfamily